MSFLIGLVLLGLPIWLARRGYSRIKIGLGIISAAILPVLVFLALPGPTTALAVVFAIPFVLIGLTWTVVSVMIAFKLQSSPK